MARDVGNSTNDIEILEEIGDFLSQFYNSIKVNESPELKPNNCSSLSSSGAFLAEVDSRYESYLLEIKEKSLQADAHLSAARKEKNALKKIYSEEFKDERQALQHVIQSGSDDASFVSELKIPSALESYSPEIDVFPGKDVDQEAAAAQRQQQEQLLAAAAEQEELAVLQQEQVRIKGLAADQEAAAAQRQQQEQLLAAAAEQEDWRCCSRSRSGSRV